MRVHPVIAMGPAASVGLFQGLTLCHADPLPYAARSGLQFELEQLVSLVFNTRGDGTATVEADGIRKRSQAEYTLASLLLACHPTTLAQDDSYTRSSSYCCPTTTWPTNVRPMPAGQTAWIACWPAGTTGPSSRRVSCTGEGSAISHACKTSDAVVLLALLMLTTPFRRWCDDGRRLVMHTRPGEYVDAAS